MIPFSSITYVSDVVLAYYLAGEEYADKPVFVSLQYDGSKFRTIQDFSRTGFGDLSYYSDVFSYMLEFDTGKEKILMLSDDPNFDYEAYRAEINAVPEDPDALTALPEYHGAIILLWEKVMPEEIPGQPAYPVAVNHRRTCSADNLSARTGAVLCRLITGATELLVIMGGRFFAKKRPLFFLRIFISTEVFFCPFYT